MSVHADLSTVVDKRLQFPGGAAVFGCGSGPIGDAPAIGPRYRNAAATRQAILEAAKLCFMDDGYEQVGVRDIAARAGVDPALVNRYFGSKEGLFSEAVASKFDLSHLLDGDRATLGERLARYVLQKKSPGARLRSARRAAALLVERRLQRHAAERHSGRFCPAAGGAARRSGRDVTGRAGGIDTAGTARPPHGHRWRRSVGQ